MPSAQEETKIIEKTLEKHKEQCPLKDKDTWFDNKMYRHYVLLGAFFFSFGAGLFVWGFNKNTVDAIQDERIYEIKKSMDEIKQQGKETLLKVNEIDKKIIDSRVSVYIPTIKGKE